MEVCHTIGILEFEIFTKAEIKIHNTPFKTMI